MGQKGRKQQSGKQSSIFPLGLRTELIQRPQFPLLAKQVIILFSEPLMILGLAYLFFLFTYLSN